MTDTKKQPPEKLLSQVGKIRRLRLTNLDAASYNPRVISDESFRGLRESLERFGLLEMPVVNNRDGELRLVSGHQRVRAMIAEGVEEADCLVVTLDDVDERIANLTMNNPAIRGTFDAQKAVEQIPQFSANLPRPNYAEFDKLIDDLRKKADRLGVEAGPEATEVAETKKAKPRSKPGKTYVLGKHRVFCGSFEDGLPAMLGKKRADACITDPPYNVDYESAEGVSIANDAMTPAAWSEFIGKVATSILKHTAGPSAVCMSSKEVPSLTTAWRQSGGAILRWLFWVKDRFTLGRGDYHHQHEPILLGAPPGASPTLQVGLTSVLEFPKPATNPLHPTQKPVPLIRALMERLTDAGDVVIDPFSGSGTTLVVAEELGRKCLGCELEPMFVDAIRKRWAEQVHGEGCDWVKLTPAA